MAARSAAAAAAVLLGLAVAVPAQAGTLVVSGDTNIVDPLTGSQSAPINPGNATFFSNLLGASKKVAVDYGDGRGLGTVAPADLQQYYGGLGASVALYHDNLTAADLQGVQLLVTSLPDAAYSAPQLSAISALLARGGTVLFMGENAANFSAQNIVLNADLAGLGSSLSLGVDSLDPDFQQATGAMIASAPLTQGVASLTYAWTDSVTGGNALFSTLDGTPFIETQTITAAVPEPTSLALMLAGVAGLATLRRRPRA